MILIPWLVGNSNWLVPALGWAYSEFLGWKSGGKSASVSQIILDFIKEVFVLLKKKMGD